MLEDDEIVVEITFPAPVSGTKGKFIKFALRKSIDFPIVNCAAVIENEGGVVKSARICLNAVYSNPYRAIKPRILSGASLLMRPMPRPPVRWLCPMRCRCLTTSTKSR